MAPRLAHKKSRKGCQRCKARRVKCDEKHPSCSSCSKHDVPCAYSDPFHHVTNPGGGGGGSGSGTVPGEPESEEGSSSNPPSPVITGPTSPYSDQGDVETAFDPEERRKLELYLLHHFMSIVTYTFPACNQQMYKDMWSIDAVRLAFEFPFLFNAILAISALHLVCDTSRQAYFYAKDSNPEAAERITRAPHMLTSVKADFAKVHRMYMNLAIQQQRDALQNFSTENADAIFVASILLAYQSIRLIPDRSESSAYLPPVQWMRMSKAIQIVVEAVMPVMRSDSVVAFILNLTLGPDFRDMKSPEDPLASREQFKHLLDYDKFPEPGSPSPEEDAKIKYVYGRVLSYVGDTYQSLLDKETPRLILRRIMYLPVLNPGTFINLVEERRPRALIILAHGLALAKAVDEHWWVRGLAEREVKGIQSALPAEWWWAMEWPLSMIKAGENSTSQPETA